MRTVAGQALAMIAIGIFLVFLINDVVAWWIAFRTRGIKETLAEVIRHMER